MKAGYAVHVVMFVVVGEPRPYGRGAQANVAANGAVPGGGHVSHFGHHPSSVRILRTLW